MASDDEDLDALAARLRSQVKKPVKYQPTHFPQGPPDLEGAVEPALGVLPWPFAVAGVAALIARRRWRRRRSQPTRRSTSTSTGSPDPSA